MPRFTPTQVPAGNSLDNLARWLREEFEQVRLSTDDIYALAAAVLDDFVAAGYGSVYQEGSTPLNPINTTYQRILFNTQPFEPKAISFDLAQDQYIFDAPGIWLISLSAAISFDETNAGRQLKFRQTNVNQGVSTSGAVVFVARNQGGTTNTLTFMAGIDETETGQPYILEIGSDTDTFANCTLLSAVLSISHVSEFKGQLVQESVRSL